MISKPCGIFISPKGENFLKGSIPLSLLSVATAVKDIIDVIIVDLNLKKFNLKNIVKQKKPLFFVITNNYTINFYNTARLIKRLKSEFPEIVIITGGMHSTFDYENLINLGTDYVVRHEGEITFRQLAQYIIGDKKTELSMIKGIVHKKNNKIILNEDREPIENLDDLPIPDYNLLGKEFKKHFFKKIRIIETSRGCTYKCAFCSDISMWYHKYRKKSPIRVLKEFIKAKHDGVKFIVIADSNMSNNPKNLKEICNLLIKNKNEIPWMSQHRADLISNNPTLVKLMKMAKCKVIAVGYESMNKKILGNYNKTITPSMSLDTLKILKKNKIISQGGNIIGAPNETLREMMKTIKFAFKLDFPNLSLLKSYPGSELKSEKSKNKDYTNFKEINLYNPLKITGFLQKVFLLVVYLNPKRLLTLVSSDESMRIYSRSTYAVYLNAIKNILRL